MSNELIKTRVHIVKCAESDYQKLTYKNPLCIYITNATGDFSAQEADAKANIYIGAYQVAANAIIPGGNDTMKNVITKYIIQSTGGGLDIQTGDAKLVSIKGSIDDNYRAFIADTFVSTEMNLVNPDQYLTINGHKAYYFIVEKGVMGAIGSTNQNNGYIIIGGDVAGVYYSASKPTAADYGSACGYTDGEDEVRHYTPTTAGWLTILTNDDVAPACHLIWSGRHNDEAGVYGVYTKSILAAIQAVHSWGLSGLIGPYDSSYDEVNLVEGKGYPRNDMVQLSNLSWVMSDVTVNGNSAKAFTATVSAMKSGGLFSTNYNDVNATLSVSGNVITIVSETIASVEDLLTSLGASIFYYQKASYTAVNIDLPSSIKVNDMGLEYFMYNGDLAPVAAVVEESYYLGITDQILNAIAEITNISRILAEALCGIIADIGSINVDNAGDLRCKSIDSDELPSYCGYPSRIIQALPENTAPTVTPDFIGQEFYDTFNRIIYGAIGTASASDWLRKTANN